MKKTWMLLFLAVLLSTAGGQDEEKDQGVVDVIEWRKDHLEAKRRITEKRCH